MNNDEQLVGAFRQVIDGIGNEQRLFDLIEDQIFGLVLPVIKSEKKSDAVTGSIMTELCESADAFNMNKNLNRQIARFTSVYLYKMLLENGARLQTSGNLVDYPYTMIKEDAELYDEMKKIVRIFRNPDLYHKADKAFKRLEPMEIVLLQMFGYETYTIDQMEDMLEVDSSFLCNAIMRAKASLLDIDISEPGENSYGEAPYDEDIEDEEERSFGILAMIFPKLSKKALMGIRCAIIVFILGNIIFLAFSLIHDMSSVKNKPKENTTQTTMQQTTEATRAERTTEVSKTQSESIMQTSSVSNTTSETREAQSTTPQEQDTSGESSTSGEESTPGEDGTTGGENTPGEGE
ncbi:MAG: hypothetical protein Q4F11_08245, partial [Eubacteriales bacterium]|nr:hypothetical protein [Eubacteriales bacterium]